MSKSLVLEKNRSLTLREIRNVICGTLILLYCVSHILLIRMPDPDHGLPNVVFPMLPNRIVYSFAAFLEFVVGANCIVNRKVRSATLGTVFFIAVICWYRVSIKFLGGDQTCNCLGFLGRILSVSRTTEQVVPIVTLAVLTGLVTPWTKLWRVLRPQNKIGVFSVGLLFTTTFAGVPDMYGLDGYRIQGTITVNAYNPISGREYENQQANSHFSVVLYKNAYQLQIDCENRPGWKISCTYDGENFLVLPPSESIFSADSPIKEDAKQLAILSSEPIPKLDAPDRLGISMLWITFCLQSHISSGAIANNTEIPLLWWYPRVNPMGYGYRWQVSATDDKLFAKSVSIVRDSSLDLDKAGEFNRLGINVENTVSEKNRFTKILKIRSEQPDGFEVGRFTASSFVKDTGVPIPASAELIIHNQKLNDATHYWRRYTVTTQRVEIVKNVDISLPTIDKDTAVQDFRLTEKRGAKFYRVSEYNLARSGSWPQKDDSMLISRREQFFRSPIPTLLSDGHLLAWISIAAILVIFMVIYTITIKRDKINKNNKNTI